MCEHCKYLPVALKREWVPEWLWRMMVKPIQWKVWPFRQILTTSDPVEMQRLLHLKQNS